MARARGPQPPEAPLHEMERVAPDPPERGDLLAAGATMQRMQTTYATAVQVQKPREITRVDRQALAEADLMGEAAFYAWGKGKNRVEGPSVKLAMMIARVWGNCALDMLPVQETDTGWIFSASFVDLETGFTLTRQFRQAKDWTVYGDFDQARKEDIRFQIGQSKATRNVILNAVPEWLVDKCIEQAKGNVRGKIMERIKKMGGEDKVQDAMLAKLEKYGITPQRVLNLFGRPTVRALSIEDLVILAANIKALETGTDTVESLFPVSDQKTHAEVDVSQFVGSTANRGHDDTRTEQLAPQAVDAAAEREAEMGELY